MVSPSASRFLNAWVLSAKASSEKGVRADSRPLMRWTSGIKALISRSFLLPKIRLSICVSIRSLMGFQVDAST